jgi:hypothetical protein
MCLVYALNAGDFCEINNYVIFPFPTAQRIPSLYLDNSKLGGGDIEGVHIRGEACKTFLQSFKN